MKTSHKTSRILTASIATVLTSLLPLGQDARAASGSWNVDAAGNWSTTTNWNPAAVPGIAAGDVVNLQFNITAARTVMIDTTSRSVGDLNIGDPTATLFGYTLAASGGAVLILDGAGASDATVDFTANIANTISAPITLVDNGIFRSNLATAQVISGVISGVGKTLVFNNDTNGTVNAAVASQGQFNVSGVNTYTGGTSISDVRVQAGSATALGTGAVNIAAGGQVFGAAAITLANAFNINGNGWLETATGQPFGALRLDSGTIVSGAVTMQSNSAIGSNTGTGTISGVISGAGFGLTKVGAGTLVLGSANTYDGGTTVNAGILQLNNATAAGTATTISLANGGSGRLRVNGGLTIGYDVTVGTGQAGAVGEGLIQSVGTGQATLNGVITLNGAATAGGTFVGGTVAGNELVLNGAINGSPTLGISQRDGRVIYKGGGSVGGLFTVTGTAFVGANNGLPTLLVPFLGGSGNATLDLNGFNQEVGGLTRNANTTTVTTSVGASVLTLNVAGTNNFGFSGPITGGLSLVKNGAGTQKISGVNTFTGGTTVNNGTLIATATGALGSNSGLTVAGGNFSYQPTAAGALNLGSGAISLAGGTTIGGALAGATSQSAIASTGAATTAGAVTVDVWMIPNVAPTAGANDLITAASGLDTATYTLGKVFNLTDTTVSGLAASPTSVSITVTPSTALSTAFWRGGLAGAANVWAVSDGSTQSNWVATAGGTIQPLVPAAFADVTISDSTVTTAAAPSTLGANMSINSLTISDTVNGLALNADGFGLTVGLGGITVASGVPASTIAAPVALGAAQTWANNSASALTVSGVVSGANALAKAGNGTLILSGANTNTGGVNLDAGTLSLGSTTALGAVGGNFTISGGTLDTTLATLTMGNAKPTVINGDFTFAGTGNLNLSTGAVSLGTAAGTTRTITVNASTLTLGGIVSNGTTANSITKSGAGTLVLSGVNLCSGLTSVTGGFLQIPATTGLGDNSVTNTIALSGGGRVSASATLDFGVNRTVAIGAGGGGFSTNATGAVTLTVSGNIAGSDPLSFRTLSSGAGTYTLSGTNNSGYTGAIAVESAGTGVSTLNITTAAALPAASSITLNFPAAATATGAATTLSLQTGITLPATTTLNFTSALVTAALSLRSGMALNGNVILNSPITLSGDGIIQFNGAAASTTTYNNSISEATPGSYNQSGLQLFSNVLFFRGTGTHIINGSFSLPSIGSTVSVTDGATLLLNSTGNSFASTASVFGTIRIGATNAAPTTARLLIGQAGDQAATFDLNGFDQTVTGLEWGAPTGNLLTKGISNSSATTTSTFTVIQPTAPVATTFNGTISGKVNFVKDGAATVTLGAAASNFTGNVTVNNGMLTASAAGAAAGTAGTLGVANLAGKTVTVNAPGTLNFTSNNIFGNGIGNTNLPAVILSGGTLTATRYNVLGDLTLNGGTLTQAATDSGNFEGYQFRGGVTVGGSAASTIATTNAKANHLGANTVFNVANATGDATADLVVSAPLRNQSGDFATAAGALTKSGNGKMALTAANTFTGGVIVDQGVLTVNSDAALGAAAGPVAINNNATLQADGAVTTAARTITLGTGGAIIDTNGNDVTFDVGSTVSGTTLTKSGAGKLVLAGLQSYSVLDTEGGRTDLASALGTGASQLIANAETNISVSQSLTGLTIGDGAVVTLGSPLPPAPAFAFEAAAPAADFGGGDLTGAPLQGVPEPGSATLLLGGILTLLGLRRRP